MRRDSDSESVAQIIRAGYVIIMMMSQEYLANAAAFFGQIFEKAVQPLLLFLIRRSRIYYDDLLASDYVAVGMSRRWKRRGLERKHEDTRPQLDANHQASACLRNRRKRFSQTVDIIRVQSKRLDDVQGGRRHYDLAALPTIIRFGRANPFTFGKLSLYYSGVLSIRKPR